MNTFYRHSKRVDGGNSLCFLVLYSLVAVAFSLGFLLLLGLKPARAMATGIRKHRVWDGLK